MAGTLSVSHIQGLATHSSPTTVSVASGHKLHAPGHIIQCIKMPPINTLISTSSSSFITTNLTGTITPQLSDSKIYITFLIHSKVRSSEDMGMGFRIMRSIGGATATAIWTSTTNYENYAYDGGSGDSQIVDKRDRVPIFWEDTPSSIAACAYTLYYAVYNETNDNPSPSVHADNNYSFGHLMEVAA